MPSSGTLTHYKNASNTANITFTSITSVTGGSIYAIKEVSDDSIQFYAEDVFTTIEDGTVEFLADQGTGTLTGERVTIEIYSRLITDSETVLG